jgi:alpha-glucosidase
LSPDQVRANQKTRLAAIPPGGWPANTLGNHDRPRSIEAHSDGVHDQELARLSLAMLLTLPGTPFLYYGEEIGMTNFFLDDLDLVQDRVSNWVYQSAIEQGLAHEAALTMAIQRGRDRCRTPMQWANTANAGFSPPGVRTWLPVNPDYADGVNVGDQVADPDSLLYYYRHLLHLRRELPALQSGDYLLIPKSGTDVLAYLRQIEGYTAILTALNFSPNTCVLNLGSFAPAAQCLFSTHKKTGGKFNLAELTLAPFEVCIAECLT